MNFNSLFCFNLLILLIGLTISIRLKMSVKNIRNIFNLCVNESNCEECSEDGQYKFCKNYCYCCNLDKQCKAQN